MENLKPIENKKVIFVRLSADLQVCSVYRCLKKLLPSENWEGKKKCLDVGCGDSPNIFMLSGHEYKCIDYDGSDSEFGYKKDNVEFYDGKHFPVDDDNIDLLIHTEVAEHVPDINLFFSECYRVLNKKGIMFFSIPFS